MKNLTLAVAALMMIGAVGCSSAPVVPEENNGPHAEMPATIETQSATTSPADVPADTSLPANVDDSAPSSLGASSSGRGH